jgi:hypothetical protein
MHRPVGLVSPADKHLERVVKLHFTRCSVRETRRAWGPGIAHVRNTTRTPALSAGFHCRFDRRPTKDVRTLRDICNLWLDLELENIRLVEFFFFRVFSFPSPPSTDVEHGARSEQLNVSMPSWEGEVSPGPSTHCNMLNASLQFTSARLAVLVAGLYIRLMRKERKRCMILLRPSTNPLLA